MIIDLQVDPMAKDKSKSKPNSPPQDPTRKPMVVQVRGSEKWKAWVEFIADKEGDTVAKLVERTLRKFAKDAGYPDPPKR
jgi:hypothetical protein